MNKYFQRMMKIVALILCFTLGVTCVGAKSGESITIDKKHLIYSGVASRSEAKFHTTMGYAWCITPRKTGADQGAVLKFTREEADGGVLYLLDHADTNDSGYILTQLALWMYESDYLPQAYIDNSSNSVVKKARNLAATARNNKNYTVEPAIVIDQNNQAMTLEKIGDRYFYVSKQVKVTLSNASEYTLALDGAPNGSYIVDANGNEKSSFKSGDTFAVRVPENSVTTVTNISVIVKTTGTRKYVERYSPSNSKLQDLVVIRTEKKTISSKTTFTVSPEKRTCEIFNGRYYGINGNVVNEQQYKDQCLKICKVEGNNYYGIDGKKVTEQQYKDQCLKICKVEGNNYYGKDGEQITKEEYEKICVPAVDVDVPDTGSNTDSTNVVVGSILAFSGLGLLFYYKKNHVSVK